MTIPVRDLLLRFAGSYPISDDGLFEIIDLLEECQQHPADIAINTARYPMRLVAALLPDTDTLPGFTIATICGQEQIMTDPRLESAIRCFGKWENEKPPVVLRRFLTDIHAGRHPYDAAAEYDLNADELYYLESILELEQHWHDQILTRAIFAVENYRGLGRWLALAHELGTWRPDVILSWRRAAKRVLKELRSARA
jgi:hypothetical protein